MVNHPNRRRIWQTASGTVILRDEDYKDAFTGECLREFWVPSQGGYVREIDEGHPGTLGRQVCNMLYLFGPTISATPDTLLAVIRREYRSAIANGRRCADI